MKRMITVENGRPAFTAYKPWTPERRAAASLAAKQRLDRKRAEQSMNTQTKIAAVPKEDGIRELHGCVAVESDGKGKRLMLLEQATFVTLGWDYHEVRITPPQCRYLAERLYSLAARVERRL